MAAEFGATPTGTAGESVYGWLNLPIHSAYLRAVALEERRSAEPPATFVADFRPHSHHWQVMAGVRAAGHQAATIEVGGAQILMAMTSVGDGFFPVTVDTDESGNPTAVHITVVGDED